MTALDGAAAPAGFEHEALFYRGGDDFLAGVLPFVRDGLASDEAVIVAEPGDRLDLVRAALGADADRVHFHDTAVLGANPARLLGVWADAVERYIGAGRALRAVGEPVWEGRREVELAEFHLHELLLNEAFDEGPAWRLMCPYDEQQVPLSVRRGALRAHPLCATPRQRTISSDYVLDGHAPVLAERLARPRAGVLSGGYGPGDVPATRRTVASWARSCGVPEDKVEVLELAASELATNSLRHGGGAGTLAMWEEAGAAVVEFSDAGHLADPLAGRRVPTLDQEGGRGLYLVNQLCDLVQLRSSAHGTTVRLHTWL